MSASTELTVEFVDELIRLAANDTLQFGRGTDGSSSCLVIDEDNLHLHRSLGEFFFRDGQWWLRNVGRSIPMRLWTSDGSNRSVVMSGSEVSLTAERTIIEFEAGRSRYELSAKVPRDNVAEVGLQRSDTISAVDLELTLMQKQLIVSLAEKALRNPGEAISVPPSKEAAARLGWKMTTFNAKLHNVCEKLTLNLGVRGLSSSSSGATMDRRLRLVEYCVLNRVVTADDLDVLDEDPASS